MGGKKNYAYSVPNQKKKTNRTRTRPGLSSRAGIGEPIDRNGPRATPGHPRNKVIMTRTPSPLRNRHKVGRGVVIGGY